MPTDQTPPPAFRCPFQIKAEANGSIISIDLVDNRQARMSLIKEAFRQFHASTTFVGLKFVVPQKVLETASSIEILRLAIVPYQSEILAMEAESRLSPFLTYQRGTMSKEELFTLFEKQPEHFAIAHLLEASMKDCHFTLPTQAGDIAEWIAFIVLTLIAAKKEDAGINLIHQSNEGPIPLASFGAGGFILTYEQRFKGDPKNNKNCFSIVRTPFYPKEFGRYSDKVEIWLTREADFTGIPSEQRRKIRRLSNEVLHHYGVLIQNPEEDKQPGGLWIP